MTDVKSPRYSIDMGIRVHVRVPLFRSLGDDTEPGISSVTSEDIPRHNRYINLLLPSPSVDIYYSFYSTDRSATRCQGMFRTHKDRCHSRHRSNIEQISVRLGKIGDCWRVVIARMGTRAVERGYTALDNDQNNQFTSLTSEFCLYDRAGSYLGICVSDKGTVR